MEDSPIGLDKWMTAFWMLCNCKNGISSYELGKNLGIRQNSAWFMLHRIREAMKDDPTFKFGGGEEGGPSKWMRRSSAASPRKMHAASGSYAAQPCQSQSQRCSGCWTASSQGSRQGRSERFARDSSERDSESGRTWQSKVSIPMAGRAYDRLAAKSSFTRRSTMCKSMCAGRFTLNGD
jgi:hypothetical protein